MAAFDTGDLVALDGDNGQLSSARTTRSCRPSSTAITRAGERKPLLRRRSATLPSVTQDGIAVSLSINAAFLIDLAELEAVGAEGCGLFRTELAFMTRNRYPDVAAQAAHYREVLDTADGRPVNFRTLDVGSDKHLPYLRMPPEDNPAMGWRAMRMVLDRPTMLRGPVAGAAAGRVGPAPAGHVPDGGRGGRARSPRGACWTWRSSGRGAAGSSCRPASRSAPWSRCRRSTGS